MSDNTENKNITISQSQEEIAKQHEVIQKLFGLNRSYEDRVESSKLEKQKIYPKTIVVFLVIVALVGVVIAGVYAGNQILIKKEQDEMLAKQQKEIEAEEARRNRIEYAEISFQESLPAQVSISMDGKKLYGKMPDGSYSELRANKDTWIRYLPIKEDTVVKFSFEAEGFKPLTRNVAYYDWYPAHKGDITLQKVFKKIVMQPDVTPRLPNCEGDVCDWSVFREIMFREKYAELAKMAVINDADQTTNRLRVFKTHPMLAQEVGIDPANMPKTDIELSPSAKNLVQFVDKHPFDLYGTITLETDVADTRVSFLGEPLMIVKSSGSMSQVKVEPDKPFTFSTYGQGHPIVITEPLSIRLEANGYPAYVMEILPHQWHCAPVASEVLSEFAPPAFSQLEDVQADYRHYNCDYTIHIKVDFNAIKAASEESKSEDKKTEEQK